MAADGPGSGAVRAAGGAAAVSGRVPALWPSPAPAPALGVSWFNHGQLGSVACEEPKLSGRPEEDARRRSARHTGPDQQDRVHSLTIRFRSGPGEIHGSLSLSDPDGSVDVAPVEHPTNSQLGRLRTKPTDPDDSWTQSSNQDHESEGTCPIGGESWRLVIIFLRIEST